MREWWRAHRPTTRRLVQLYCALLYNANIKGFVSGRIYTGAVKSVCVPGLNCYSCPGAAGTCPLGALQNAVSSVGKRAGTYVIGILLLFGLILGRTICGYLCPVGLVQELLHKIPTPKIRKSRVTRVLSYLKYVVLAVLVIGLPLWYGLSSYMPMPAFCKYLCPAGTLEGGVALLSNPANNSLFSMLGDLFTQKFVILVIIGLASVFCFRAFCRFLCPLGAIYGFFCRIAVIGVKVELTKCTHCGKCIRGCPMDVRHVGDHECINCGKCMDDCPEKAISIKAGKISLKEAEPLQKVSVCEDNKLISDVRNAENGVKNTSTDNYTVRSDHKKTISKGRIAWTVALVLLIVALVYYNILNV